MSQETLMEASHEMVRRASEWRDYEVENEDDSDWMYYNSDSTGRVETER